MGTLAVRSQGQRSQEKHWKPHPFLFPMCIIQVFTKVYPDGFRELSDRLVYCPLGTPRAPCNEKRVVHTGEERYVQWPRAPSTHPIPTLNSEAPKGENSKKRGKPADVMCFVDFHIPGTSGRGPGRRRPTVPTQEPHPVPVRLIPLPQRLHIPPTPPPPPPPPPSLPRRSPTIIQWDSVPGDDDYVRPRRHRRYRPRSPPPETRCNPRKFAREQSLRRRAEDDAREALERQLRAERDAERLRRENHGIRERIIDQERRDERRRRQQEVQEAYLDRIEREPRRRLGRGIRQEVYLHQRGRAGSRAEFVWQESGEQVIRDANQDERMAQEEERALRAGPFHRVRNANIPGRRRSVGGGRPRIIFDDESTRPRWRWI